MEGSPPTAPSAMGEPVISRENPLTVPAIILIVVHGVMLLVFLLDLGLLTFGGWELTDNLHLQPHLALLVRGFALAVCVFAILCNGFSLLGAIHMLNRNSWGLSLAGAVVSCLPTTTSICCLASLPIAVWAITVMVKPEVKAFFASARR
jgi:hypothetical protein